MGVSNWFQTFCSNLKVSNSATISMRYKAITKRLNTDFWYSNSETSNSLYVGSYGRSTAIDGVSDVDMLFVLPSTTYKQYNEHYGNGQSALLQAVRNSIMQTYPSTAIGADGQVVVVNFGDSIAFDVVPAFINTIGTFTFPNSNDGGSWKTTNPKAEIEAMRVRNNSCNGNLYMLCKMMRSWKEFWSVPIGGLLIDTLAYQFINSWSYKDKSYLYYDFMCKDFFEYMRLQSKEQSYWKAPGSSQFVWRGEQFEYKATRCYNISLEALNYATDKQDWSAKNKWREIFGSNFPS